jgi:tRNA pseudouridine65 synthase
MSENPSVIHQDSDLLVLFKPARMYVHPPESRFARQNVTGTTCLQWIKENLDLSAKPIHRLDFATEGLVIFGLNQPATKKMNEEIRNHRIKKKYHAVVRGWFKNESGEISTPLELDSTGELVDCLTKYNTLAKIELPFSVNSKFPTSRYSFLDIQLITGRWHQIRRHMNREAHPIIGDREHGDSHHNRFFRDQFAVDGLCLKAYEIEFEHPVENKIVRLEAPMTNEWQKLMTVFKFKENL